LEKAASLAKPLDCGDTSPLSYRARFHFDSMGDRLSSNGNRKGSMQDRGKRQRLHSGVNH
jgi:hypothetical protein